MVAHVGQSRWQDVMVAVQEVEAKQVEEYRLMRAQASPGALVAPSARALAAAGAVQDPTAPAAAGAQKADEETVLALSWHTDVVDPGALVVLYEDVPEANLQAMVSAPLRRHAGPQDPARGRALLAGPGHARQGQSRGRDGGGGGEGGKADVVLRTSRG